MPYQKGHKHSEEVKLKIKNALIGKQKHWLGRKHTAETRKKMSLSQKGKKFSKKHRENISKSKIGKKLSDKRRKQISIQTKKMWADPKRRKRQSEVMKGRKFTEEHKEKLRMVNLGKKMSKEAIEKMRKNAIGRIPTIKGKTFEEFYGCAKAKRIKKKMSQLRKGWKNPFKGKRREEMDGKNNPNWRGGSSTEPYPFMWSEKLREQIRKRDGYKCQLCNIKQKKTPENLHIHHIDYNKKNCELNNLISLCRSCHCKTNGHRTYFANLFSNLLIKLHNYKINIKGYSLVDLGFV